MKLTECLRQACITVDLKAETGDEVLEEMARIISSQIENIDSDQLVGALRTRENLGTTAMGNELAFPHARISGFPNLVTALGVSRRGVDFKAIDGQPVRFFVVLVTGRKASKKYLQVLASFCSIGRDPKRRDKVLSAKSPLDLCEVIESFNISFEN